MSSGDERKDRSFERITSGQRFRQEGQRLLFDSEVGDDLAKVAVVVDDLRDGHAVLEERAAVLTGARFDFSMVERLVRGRRAIGETSPDNWSWTKLPPGRFFRAASGSTPVRDGR